MDLPPDELISLILAEIERIHGRDYAEHTVCEVDRAGWFYLGFPIWKGEEWTVNPLPTPMRRRELLGVLEELRNIP